MELEHWNAHFHNGAPNATKSDRNSTTITIKSKYRNQGLLNYKLTNS